MAITINGKKYKVVETLSWHQVGMPAKMVKDATSKSGERVAVKQCGEWRFWEPKDRLQPGSCIVGM